MRRYNSYVNVKDEVNAKANGNGCPVPKGGTGRYKVKGHVNCQEPAGRRRYESQRLAV